MIFLFQPVQHTGVRGETDGKDGAGGISSDLFAAPHIRDGGFPADTQFAQ